MIDRITLRLFLTGDNLHIFIKCALSEGMGTGIPIKIVGMQKSPNGVSVIRGESCSSRYKNLSINKIQLFSKMLPIVFK